MVPICRLKIHNANCLVFLLKNQMWIFRYEIINRGRGSNTKNAKGVFVLGY